MDRDFADAHDATNPSQLYIPPKRTILEPKKWSDYRVSAVAGSYAYALNLPSAGMKTPGFLNQNTVVEPNPSEITYEMIYALMTRDGALNIPADCIPQNGEHIIALRFGKGFDKGNLEKAGILPMRRDGDGVYSYSHDFNCISCNYKKPATNLDLSGAPINNPETAEFEGIESFGGYWAFPFKGVPFKPAVGIPAELGFGNYPMPDDPKF